MECICLTELLNLLRTTCGSVTVMDRRIYRLLQNILRIIMFVASTTACMLVPISDVMIFMGICNEVNWNHFFIFKSRHLHPEILTFSFLGLVMLITGNELESGSAEYACAHNSSECVCVWGGGLDETQSLFSTNHCGTCTTICEKCTQKQFSS